MRFGHLDLAARRERKNVPFSWFPTYINNCVVHLRADTGLHFASGNLVSKWDDQTVNGYDHVIYPGNPNPTYVPDILAGYGAVEFTSGSANVLYNATAGAEFDNAPVTVCMVVRLLDSIVSKQMCGIMANDGLAFVRLGTYTRDTYPYYRNSSIGNATFTLAPVADKWYLLEFYLSANLGGELFANTISQGTIADVGTISGLSCVGIGGYASAVGQESYGMQIAEVVMFNVVLNANEKYFIRTYFGKKFSLW